MKKYSGLKLKGRKIYAGDKLRVTYEDGEYYDGVVTFERGCFVVREEYFDYEKNNETPMTLWTWLQDENTEVL